MTVIQMLVYADELDAEMDAMSDNDEQGYSLLELYWSVVHTADAVMEDLGIAQ